MSEAATATAAGCIGSGSGRHIGRVGALAVALGIGAAIVAMPAIASADTGDSTGTADSARTGPKASPSKGPTSRDGSRRTAAPSASRTPAAASRAPLQRTRPPAPSNGQLASVSVGSPAGVDGGPDAPAAEPLMWAAAAVTRRGVDRRVPVRSVAVSAPVAVAVVVDPATAVEAALAVDPELVTTGAPQIHPLGFPTDQPDGGAAPPVDPSPAPRAPDQILLGWKPGVTDADRAAVLALIQATVSSRLGTKSMIDSGEGVDVLVVPGGIDAALQALANNPAVDFAEPNYQLSNSAIASDSYYTSGALWGMESSDSPVDYGPSGTTNEFGSGAEQAWGLGFTGSTGSPRRIVIGIIDTGIQITHPELAANIWVNPGEIPGDGIDNDRNGYIDDVNGWDFYYNDNTVYDGTSDSHGTHVAGTIAAVGDNGTGVAGACWSCQIIPAKFLGPNGGWTSDAVRALDYLTDLKTRYNINLVATNNSWGGGNYSYTLHGAILRAAKGDILFVAAAGNSASNNDTTNSWPSNYSTLQSAGSETAASYEAVVAVASITSTGSLSSFSSYGATTVDLGAPGSSIVSTLPTNSYGYYSGTSMATPHVTGAIALYAAYRTDVFSQTPTAAQLRTAILSNAKPTTSLAGKTTTGGRLNLEGLFVRPAPTPPAPSPSPDPAPVPVVIADPTPATLDPTPAPTPDPGSGDGITPAPTPTPILGPGQGLLLSLITNFLNNLFGFFNSLFGLFLPGTQGSEVTPARTAVTTQLGVTSQGGSRGRAAV